jgi:uncharacterized protein (DUF433 family)
VESVPERKSGAWVFRGTRMPVATVFENLEAGASIEEIMEQFHVTRDQIKTVLEFVALSLAVEEGEIDTLAVGNNPAFRDMITRSRQRMRKEGGIPEEEVKRILRIEWKLWALMARAVRCQKLKRSHDVLRLA